VVLLDAALKRGVVAEAARLILRNVGSMRLKGISVL